MICSEYSHEYHKAVFRGQTLKNILENHEALTALQHWNPSSSCFQVVFSVKNTDNKHKGGVGGEGGQRMRQLLAAKHKLMLFAGTLTCS